MYIPENATMSLNPRFQDKVDVVKEHIKNPCADLLAVEVKYKTLKKDIVKAKRSREQNANAEQNANNEPNEEQPDPVKPHKKRQRRKTPEADPEPKPKAKAKAKSGRSKRKTASWGNRAERCWPESTFVAVSRFYSPLRNITHVLCCFLGFPLYCFNCSFV